MENKFKIGDVLAINTNTGIGLSYVVEIIPVVFSHGTIPHYEMVKLGYEDKCFGYIEGDTYINGLINCDVECIGHIDLSENSSQKCKSRCNCPIFDLMNMGCKCGGT